jgi:hypothetical protein
MVVFRLAPLPDPDLRALRDKYERILRLRELSARARREPGFAEPDPRAAMAELARAFPGALRELDELPLATIHERLEALTAADDGAAPVAAWMTAQARFHALARGALAVKRWLAGRPLTPDLEASFARAKLAEVDAWRSSIGAIARPPRGRVLDLVYARLAEELGIDVASARALVVPPRRSGLRA